MPPKFKDDAILNADGYVSMFRIRNGRAGYRGRWVRTERFERNLARPGGSCTATTAIPTPTTIDPRRGAPEPAHGLQHCAAGLWRQAVLAEGRRAALRARSQYAGDAGRSGMPVAPGRARPSARIPKLDPLSGEMVAFGYEATGLASDDLYIATVNAQRHRSATASRSRCPYVSVIHDMALTHRHVVIPFGGYVTSEQRLQAMARSTGAGTPPSPAMIGVIPRGGSAKDMRWFQGPERCMMHTFNAHSEGNKVILYAPFYDSNFFPFFPPIDGTPWNPAKARAFIRKITLDLDQSR